MLMNFQRAHEQQLDQAVLQHMMLAESQRAAAIQCPNSIRAKQHYLPDHTMNITDSQYS